MKITATSVNEFVDQFKEILKQDECNNINNIVYFWRVEKPFQRVKGKSNIVYIGQTKRTLAARYSNSQAFKIETSYFDSFYKFVIAEYGALSIEIIQTDNVKKSEWLALQKYRDNHFEYPPLNRSIPRKPE